MTDKIREVADGILAAMRHADPRPGDNRPGNKRSLGNADARPTGKRRNRPRRKTSEQVKALRKLGWPVRRIAALSEEAATTIIAKGREYDREAEVARARLQEIADDPSALIKGDKLKARLDKLKVNPQNEGADDMNTYSHKSNARRAARAELGAKATEGVDYRLIPRNGGFTVPHAGCRWGWQRLSRKTGDTGAKEGTLKALLARKGGATVREICEDTGWLPHTARARISGLRKAGVKVERFKTVAIGRGQETKYRIMGAA